MASITVTSFHKVFPNDPNDQWYYVRCTVNLSSVEEIDSIGTPSALIYSGTEPDTWPVPATSLPLSQVAGSQTDYESSALIYMGQGTPRVKVWLKYKQAVGATKGLD